MAKHMKKTAKSYPEEILFIPSCVYHEQVLRSEIQNRQKGSEIRAMRKIRKRKNKGLLCFILFLAFMLSVLSGVVSTNVLAEELGSPVDIMEKSDNENEIIRDSNLSSESELSAESN